VVQLRLLTDIVAFDLTYIYLMLDVLRDGEEAPSANPARKASVLKLTLPECHVFLRALREFHGLIEVTTPVLEEAKRLRAQRNGSQSPNGGKEASAGAESENSLDAIMERLNTKIAEHSGPHPET
jgi:hypothetical protein